MENNFKTNLDHLKKEENEFRNTLKVITENNKNESNKLFRECQILINELRYESNIKLDNNLGRLITNDNISDLKNVIGGSKMLTNIYSGSNKLFSAKEFHRAVENKASILVLIKTKYSNFGFYTSKTFDPDLSKGKYIKDKQAMLFTLNINNEKNFCWSPS